MRTDRLAFALALAVCTTLLALSLGGAVAAPATPPPSGSAGPLVVPAQPTLGQSGLSFRYRGTLGVTGEPYLVDNYHLNTPYGIAADGTNIWVAEAGGQRLLKFDSSGQVVKTIGHPGDRHGIPGQPSGANVGYNWINDVAVAGSSLWVVDGGSQIALKIDQNGVYQAVLGTGYQPGNDNSHFSNPRGIALDSRGYIYVADTLNHRVQVFDGAKVGTAEDPYVATIGVTGQAGWDDSHLNEPGHLAIYQDAVQYTLYIADTQNHRVQILDVSNPAAPVRTGTIGVPNQPGEDSAHLNQPNGVAVDAGHVYVADSSNARVQVFSRTTLGYEGTFGGSGSGNTQLKWPTDVALTSDGHIYVADQENHRVQKLNSSLGYVATLGTTGVPYLTDDQHFNLPRGIAAGADGSLFIAEQGGKRLIKLAPDGATAWKVGTPGVGGEDSGSFRDPSALALGPDGRVYVADAGNNRIQVYNPDGSSYANLGTGWGSGPYQFIWPQGVAVGRDGWVYVADTNNQRVQVFDQNWTLRKSLGVLGEWGGDDAHFSQPFGVAVDSDNTLYVADRNNHRVQVFERSASDGLPALNRSIGFSQECAPDYAHLCNVVTVAVDGRDNVFIADQGGGRVQVYDRFGAYLATIGNAGTTDAVDQFHDAQGLAVGADGGIGIADAGSSRIQVYRAGYPGWMQANVSGFGSQARPAVTALAAYGGRLYAAAGLSSPPPGTAEMWQSEDGRSWSRASVPWSAATVGVFDARPAGSHLYVGTVNHSEGAEIWRTDGTAWEKVASGGLGNVHAYGFEGFASYKGRIYAVTDSDDGSIAVVSSPTGAAGTWVKSADGPGSGGTTEYKTMETFGDALYVGLGRWKGPGQSAGELWRTFDGVNWAPVVGDWASNPANSAVVALAEHAGALYLGTRNVVGGAELWRSTDGVMWTKVFDKGLGDSGNGHIHGLVTAGGWLYATFGNRTTGAEVWRSTDGARWEQLADAGWGNSTNMVAGYADHAVTVYGEDLYVGGVNQAAGAPIWTRPLWTRVYLPFLKR